MSLATEQIGVIRQRQEEIRQSAIGFAKEILAGETEGILPTPKNKLLKRSGEMEFNRNDDYFCRAWSKKIRAVKVLGGKCKKCGIKDIFVLMFHHRKNKSENVSRLIFGDRKWKIILAEIKKCKLLCKRCHIEEHYGGNNNKLKIRLLELKGVKSCEQCGYDKSISALDFHHLTDKDFIISDACRAGQFFMPIETIILEMDKCQILCANCHARTHSDTERFNRLKSAIDNKVKFLKLQTLIPRQRIVQMFKRGAYASQIARTLKCGTSTVSRILKQESKARVGNTFVYKK